MTATYMRGIDTVYRGYRFRSRLEARWAHFLTLVGAEWEYEPDGYEIGGKRYLPDFYLPANRTILEVKPRRGEGVDEKPMAAVRAGGELFDHSHPERRRMVVVYGDPLNAESDEIDWLIDEPYVFRTGAAMVCPSCHAVQFPGNTVNLTGTWESNCGCGRWTLPSWQANVIDAALAARQARFEHGQQPELRAHLEHRFHDHAPRIYLAGKIGGKTGWRRKLGVPLGYDEDDDRYGSVLEVGSQLPTKYRSWTYNGPDLRIDHGSVSHGIVDDCLRRVARSNTVFAWIDSADTHGTLAELGFCRGLSGASGYVAGSAFVAFSSQELRDEMWFIAELGTIAVVVPTIEQAWDAFLEWEEFDRCYVEVGR